MKYFTTFIAALSLTLLAAYGSSAPTVDASSKEAFGKSSEAMFETLSESKRIQLLQAIMFVFYASSSEEEARKTLNGKTAAEIIKTAEELKKIVQY